MNIKKIEDCLYSILEQLDKMCKGCTVNFDNNTTAAQIEVLAKGAILEINGLSEIDKNPNSTLHELKILPSQYLDVKSGRKKFEVRRNDRNFKCGDTLLLREFNKKSDEYTGEQVAVDVKFILNGGQFGIHKNYVVMGIDFIDND